MLRNISALSKVEIKILQIVARYRIGFFKAIKRLSKIEDGRELKLALKSLVKKKLLIKQRRSETLVKATPFYFLAPAGARLLNITRDKKATNGPRAISNHLAIVWFCAFESKCQFQRIDNHVIQNVFDARLHRNCIHVAGVIQEKTVVMRVFRSETDLAGKLKGCNRALSRLPEQMQSAVGQGEYGLLVLEPFNSGVNQVRRQLGKSVRGPSLHSRARVIVALGPNTQSFATEYSRRFTT